MVPAKARSDGLSTLATLEAFIASRSELSWWPPKAGLIGLVRLQGWDGETLTRAMLEVLYKTLVIPGSAYGLPHHIRLGVGGGVAANLDDGLRRLGLFLDQHLRLT